MSDEAGSESTPDLPLDFTQFLSQRLSLEAPATLAMLGSFLLTFEPSGNYPELVPHRQFSKLPPHSDHNT